VELEILKRTLVEFAEAEIRVPESVEAEIRVRETFKREESEVRALEKRLIALDKQPIELEELAAANAALQKRHAVIGIHLFPCRCYFGGDVRIFACILITMYMVYVCSL